MNPAYRKWLFLLVVVLMVIAVDQVTKRVVIADLRLGESVQLIPPLYPFFQITRSENTGAAFGLLPQVGDLILIIAIIIVGVMLYFYPRVPEGARLTRAAMGLVMGGALGNAIDRVEHGAVIDFIHYQIPGAISNVSNLADHAIVLGAIIIFLQSWLSDSKRQPAQADESSGDLPGQS